MSGSHSSPRRRPWRALGLVGLFAVAVVVAAYAVVRPGDGGSATDVAASATASPSRTPSPRPSTAPPADRAPLAGAAESRAAAAPAQKVVPGQLIRHKPRGPVYHPDQEVWEAPQPAHPQNPDNPLAGRVWGVYTGDREDTWETYEAASGEERDLLGRIALRPKATWLGDWSASPEEIGAEMEEYIADMSGGDPDTLVQMSIFRMVPWEHDACGSGPSGADSEAYRAWVSNAAEAIGSQHTAIILQPDLPFWWCSDREAVSELMRFSVETFASLPHTSVYLDAGAADWSSTPQTGEPRPEQAAEMLLANGIEDARGFALNATHYVGLSESVAYGARLAEILAEQGVDAHFVVDTAQNGNGMLWPEVDAEGGVADNARICQSTSDRAGCATLGVPPTSRVGDPRWELPAEQRREAMTYADGFLWFSRSWMYMQAEWQGPERALDMARSTSWPGPGGW